MENSILAKAAELLSKCEVVTIASVGETGYPRISVMSKNSADGISTVWVATGIDSQKTINFRKNPKASVCYYLNHDSVTLQGNVEVIVDAATKKKLWQEWYIHHFPKGMEDPAYCLLKFTTTEATCWIDHRFETHKI